MPREVAEWIGSTPNVPIPDRVRLRVFLKAEGKCQTCSRQIRGGDKWALDHKIALINNGEHRETNLQMLCEWCHSKKTKSDTAEKSKTYAKRKSNYGIKKSKNPLPGSKASGWKRKMDGSWVRR